MMKCAVLQVCHTHTHKHTHTHHHKEAPVHQVVQPPLWSIINDSDHPPALPFCTVHLSGTVTVTDRLFSRVTPRGWSHITHQVSEVRDTKLTHTRSHFLDRMCLCLTIRFLDCGVTACDVFVYQRRFATFQTSQNTLREGGGKCSTHKLIQVQNACTFTAPCSKYNSQTKLKRIRHRLSVPPSDKLWFLLGSLHCLLFNLYFPPVDCFVIHI